MARVQSMISFTILLILFTCQMFSGEGRPIRSLNRKGISYAKSPYHRGIRKLGSQLYKSDHSVKSARKITPSKTSADFPQTVMYSQNFPSLKPTYSSPRSSHKVDSFWVNKEDSIKQSNCLVANCPDDFRPTAPGHSPGAGHFFMTNTDKISQNKPTKNPKMWKTLEESTHDSTRTTSGRSASAGHAEEDKRDLNLSTAEVQNSFPSSQTPISSFRDSTLVSNSDFRPTAPGSSPGAGHAHTNQMDVQGTENCFGGKCTNDFRPTAPGDSPGAGHSFRSNSDSSASEQSEHPRVAHPHAGGMEGYWPSNPGRSPNDGHAVLNKREPNS